MPTHQDETLPQRYARENQDYLKLCGSMTAEQVADLQLQLNNSLAREQALQQRLTAADERADQQAWALIEVEAACDLAMSAIDDDERGTNFVQIVAAIKAKAALKPAEGVGDEYRKSCEVAHKALSMENQRIVAPG